MKVKKKKNVFLIIKVINERVRKGYIFYYCWPLSRLTMSVTDFCCYFQSRQGSHERMVCSKFSFIHSFLCQTLRYASRECREKCIDAFTKGIRIKWTKVAGNVSVLIIVMLCNALGQPSLAEYRKSRRPSENQTLLNKKFIL